MENRRFQPVRSYLVDLQNRVCGELERLDGRESFHSDRWERLGGGGGDTRGIAGEGVFEKGGVNFSQVLGDVLPPAATDSRHQLAGRPFLAMGVSTVVHPRSPYVPTAHMNVRFFTTDDDADEAAWWFGGGFDLTPYYPFEEDVVHWHRIARDALQPLGIDLYPRFKEWCDRYFFLPHRDEARGVGGIFFDDFSEGGFDHAFAVMRAVGDAFLPAYAPIVELRGKHPFGERERAFQLERRGRYVEFNLLHDRGTRFGLQSGGRTESILMSLPPLASWPNSPSPDPGSPEACLLREFLPVRDWLSGTQPKR